MEIFEDDNLFCSVTIKVIIVWMEIKTYIVAYSEIEGLELRFLCYRKCASIVIYDFLVKIV